MNKVTFFAMLIALTFSCTMASTQMTFAAPEKVATNVSSKTILWHYNLDAAAARAVEQKKPMFIFFFNHYCEWCEKMKKETLSNQDIVNVLNTKFVPLQVDIDTSDLAKDLDIKSIPTMVVISVAPNGKVSTLGYKVGFMKSDEMLSFLNACLNMCLVSKG